MENTSAAHQIPDVMPMIVFDVKLGRLGKDIDFDFSGYVQYLKERQITDEDIAASTVHFKHSYFMLLAGKYSDESKKQTIYLNKLFGPRLANHALVHETEHRIAELTNTKSPIWMGKVANLGFFAGPTYIGTGYGAEYAGTSMNSNLLQETGVAIRWIGLGMALAGSLVYYGFHAEERRARKASRQHKVRWLSFKENSQV